MRIRFAIPLLLCAFSCAKTGESEDVYVERIVISIPEVSDGDLVQTRTDLTYQNSKVTLTWEEADTLGISPILGSQIYMSMQDGVGQSSAYFDGGAWALRKGETYYAYFPFYGSIYLDNTKVPFSFERQKQKGTTYPLPAASFALCCKGESSGNGSTQTFNMIMLNTILNVVATLPPGEYTRMEMVLEEPLFALKAIADITSATPALVGKKMSKTLAIDLEDVILEETSTIPVFFLTAPLDLTGKKMVVYAYTSDGRLYACEKTLSREYLAGKRYGFTCNSFEEVTGLQLNVSGWNSSEPESGIAE